MTWRTFKTAIFDCDSTLSAIEGIDELAKICSKEAEVAELTNAAMDGKVDLSEIYGQRLELLNPTKNQIVALKQEYKKTTVPFAKELMSVLSGQDVDSWIVSGGLHDAVSEYGIWLGIEPAQIFAVGASYDSLSGSWWNQSEAPILMDFTEGNLTATVGKGDLIRSKIWPTSRPRRIMFGDGSSDLAARGSVDLFVACAGVVSRENVVNEADVVLLEASLAGSLVLVIGPERLHQIRDSKHSSLVEATIEAVDSGALKFNDKALEKRFFESYNKFFN